MKIIIKDPGIPEGPIELTPCKHCGKTPEFRDIRGYDTFCQPVFTQALECRGCGVRFQVGLNVRGCAVTSYTQRLLSYAWNNPDAPIFYVEPTPEEEKANNISLAKQAAFFAGLLIVAAISASMADPESFARGISVVVAFFAFIALFGIAHIVF